MEAKRIQHEKEEEGSPPLSVPTNARMEAHLNKCKNKAMGGRDRPFSLSTTKRQQRPIPTIAVSEHSRSRFFLVLCMAHIEREHRRIASREVVSGQVKNQDFLLHCVSESHQRGLPYSARKSLLQAQPKMQAKEAHPFFFLFCNRYKLNKSDLHGFIRRLGKSQNCGRQTNTHKNTVSSVFSHTFAKTSEKDLYIELTSYIAQGFVQGFFPDTKKAHLDNQLERQNN